MKRLFGCTLAFLLLLGTTAYAQCGFETDRKETTVGTRQGDIVLSVEGGNFRLGYRCLPEREIKVTLPGTGDFAGKKLYFEIRGGEQVWFSSWDAETVPENQARIFVPFEDAREGEMTLRTEVSCYARDGKGMAGGQEISLWLLGGEEYGDNILAGEADIELREDFVHFLRYAVLAPGGRELDVDGKQMWLSAAPYRNGDGQVMIAARDITLAMEGKELPQGGIIWRPETKTAEIQAGAHRIEVTAGEKEWRHMGEPLIARAAPELKDGVLYVPLRDMAEVFGMEKISLDEQSGRVTMGG